MSVTLELLLELSEEVGLSKRAVEQSIYPLKIEDACSDELDLELEKVFVDLKVEEAKLAKINTKYSQIANYFQVQMLNQGLIGNTRAEALLELKFQKYTDLLLEYPHIDFKERTTEQGALIAYASNIQSIEEYIDLDTEEYVDELLKHKERHMRYVIL